MFYYGRILFNNVDFSLPFIHCVGASIDTIRGAWWVRGSAREGGGFDSTIRRPLPPSPIVTFNGKPDWMSIDDNNNGNYRNDNIDNNNSKDVGAINERLRIRPCCFNAGFS